MDFRKIHFFYTTKFDMNIIILFYKIKKLKT